MTSKTRGALRDDRRGSGERRPPSYEDERERSGDRTSFNGNPEITQTSEAKIVRGVENGYEPAKEIVNGVAYGSERLLTNGDAADLKSPRYISRSSERRSARISGSPPQRRESGFPGRRRGSRSPSAGSRPRRSPRSRSRSGERKKPREDGPFTQVYVTGYSSRDTRREELERYFARDGVQIVDVVMKSRFAFIEFKKPEDAAEAVRTLDRSDFYGRSLTVQQSCKIRTSRFY